MNSTGVDAETPVILALLALTSLLTSLNLVSNIKGSLLNLTFHDSSSNKGLYDNTEGLKLF